MFVKHFKELASGNNLAVRRRFHKCKRRPYKALGILKGRRHYLSFRINDAQIDSRDSFQPIYGALKYLI